MAGGCIWTGGERFLARKDAQRRGRTGVLGCSGVPKKAGNHRA